MTFLTEEEGHQFLKKHIKNFDTAKPMPIVMPTTHGCWTLGSPRDLEKPAKTCSICYQQFHEYGNNALPVNDGRCCNYCDEYIVTPARIALAEANQ